MVKQTIAVAFIALLSITLAAAAQSTSPTFDVVSIKPASAPRPGRLVSIQIVTTPGRLAIGNATLKDLIAGAYSVERYQVFGGPGWADSARFDVEGKTSADTTGEQRLLMLRGMLADRFKLTIHREAREMAVNALVLDGKRSPKLRPLDPTQASCWPSCENSPAPLNHMRLSNMPSLANYLTRLGSDKPVVDKTGLTGNFAIDFDVSKAMPRAQNDAGIPPGNTAIYEATIEALQEELDLKIIPIKASMEVVIIDRAEQPAAN